MQQSRQRSFERQGVYSESQQLYQVESHCRCKQKEHKIVSLPLLTRTYNKKENEAKAYSYYYDE